MGILLDLILLGTIVISLLLGVRSGVVRSLVGFAGGLFAMAASAMLSGFASWLWPTRRRPLSTI